MAACHNRKQRISDLKTFGEKSEGSRQRMLEKKVRTQLVKQTQKEQTHKVHYERLLKEESLLPMASFGSSGAPPTCRDDLIRQYFFDGLSYEEIRVVLHLRHGFSICIRQLKRIFRRMNLRRRGVSNIQVVRRAVQQELNGNGAYLGCRSMRSRLLSSYGLSVPRDTVLQLQRELDPEGVDMRSCHRLSRRVYINKGPNYLVHIDGYDKLKPFGFAIHGAICGFSRKILWLEVSNTNNNPYVVASYFLNFIETLQGVPRCIRMDAGTENGVIEDMQKSFRWHHTDEMAGESSVIIGSSNSNQRIERWWRSMKEGGIAFWIDLFKDLQNTNAINFSDDFERDCLRYSCMDVIQADLNRIRDEWNTHLPRRVNGQLNGRPDLMYSMPEMYDAHDYKFEVCATDVADLWQCCTRPRPKGVDDDFQTLCDEIFRNQAMRPPSNSQECLVLFDLLTATLTH
ncbi:uncharacterized protein [Haliotis cracherodii]|uniref:uncharacterized protein n=1 Tax=Haliotis cracherodii TaxID=6455 RepID=UPI0039EA3661